MTTSLDSEYLTVRQAAELLHVSQSTVWRWIDRGELVAVRAGRRRVLIARTEADRMVRPARPNIEALTSEFPEPPGELTPEEQARMLRFIEAADRFREKLLAENGGKLFPPSVDLINESREERSEQLAGT